MMNGQILNIENVSRDAQVKRTTLDNWFTVLEDTLLGFRLPGWRPSVKVRESAHAKFYWFDSGVARAAGGLLSEPVALEWLGYSLETQILHEIKSYMEAQRLEYELSYYRTAADVEVDLIIQLRKKTHTTQPEVVCLEIKNSKKWDRRWERGMRNLVEDQSVRVRNCIGIYRGKENYFFDPVQIMPVEKFLASLHQGEIL